MHSPLLRESYLVSCPPLTYMLKFSGFSYLTSCLGGRLSSTEVLRRPEHAMQQMASETLNELIDAEVPHALNASDAQVAQFDAQIRTSSSPARSGKPLALRGRGTEAGMLSGISRKRSIRSNPYWFTEFCNSQCLSHFAAPFIVVQAETSVAESCK